MLRKTIRLLRPRSLTRVFGAFALFALVPFSAELDFNNAFAGCLSGSIGGFGFSASLGGGGGCGGAGIGGALCTVVSWITEEGIGQAVASLAVIFLGIQAFFGKVNWGTAIMFAAGIFAIFGAQDIVSAIAPNAMGC